MARFIYNAPDFTFDELCTTATGLPNTPTKNAKERLRYLAVNYLQPLRDWLGESVIIDSGYRSKAVNDAVGGSPTSYHLRGMAVDIRCRDIMDVCRKAHFLQMRFVREGYGYIELFVAHRRQNDTWWIHLAASEDHNDNVLKTRFVTY